MPPTLYLHESSHHLRLGNAHLELTFDLTRAGALVGILDQASGCQLVRDPDAPHALFRLAVRGADRELEWLESAEASDLRWSQEQTPSSLTLRLDATFARGLHVQVRVTLQEDSPLSAWRMSVDGLDAQETVYELVCPVVAGVLKLGDPVPGETVAVPRQGEGYAFHDPFPVVDGLPLRTGEGPESPWVGMGQTGGRYPGGWALQLVLYYHDRAGLYLACHDAGQHAKEYHVGQVPGWAEFPVMTLSHLPGEALGTGVEITYDTMLGVFHGQWWEGADLYKAWARRQWWCEKKLSERDIPAWLRTGAGVFQMQNYDIPVLNLTHPLDEIASLVNRLAREAEIPLLALIFNFENGGGWTGPMGFFPPREGEAAFRAAMDKLRAAGNYGFVYMPGGQWYIATPSYEPPFDSWPEFEKTGRAIALTDARGEPIVGKMYDWDAASLCPQMAHTAELTASLVLGSIERGCPVVQIDNFPITQTRDCYAPAHGHPLGFGPWWSEAWNRTLADVRARARALDPDAALAVEGISENFIPSLDLFDQRAGNMEYFGHYNPGDLLGGEIIPIFSYVYGGYIGAYGAAYPECSRPEVLYWARCFGKWLVQGCIPTGGWYVPDTEGLNPVTTAFWERVARAAARECWKYLMFGEMLRPPAIEVPRIDFSYVRLLDLIGFAWPGYPEKHPERRHVVRDFAVEHGSFRADDGSLGHLFVNVSQDAQSFEVTLPSYSSTLSYRIDAVVNGERSTLQASASLPLTLSLDLEPLSVTLLECLPL